MVGELPRKVISSKEYEKHLAHVLQEEIIRFGLFQAKKYFYIISKSVEELDINYPYYPECRHLAIKSRMYRNIILDAHLIIYRITEEQIEVLDIVHAASSMNKIKKTRSIQIE